MADVRGHIILCLWKLRAYLFNIRLFLCIALTPVDKEVCGKNDPSQKRMLSWWWQAVKMLAEKQPLTVAMQPDRTIKIQPVTKCSLATRNGSTSAKG